MKFLKDLWNRIVSSNDTQYINKIAELEWIIKQKEISYNELKEELTYIESELNDEIDNNLFLKEQFDSMQETKNKLLDELEALKHIEADYEIPHDIIDVNSFGYLPPTIYWYWDGTKPVAKEVNIQIHKFYRNWDDNMFQYFRNAIKGKATYKDKFIALRKAAYDKVKYKHDLGKGLNAGENWKMPSDIFYSGIDDCDGFTTLFVTACHICNIPADRVFNATGHYKHPKGWIGHSYPICKFDDNKWYVLEGTSLRAPLLFKDNKEYKITSNNILNGLSNWNLSGKSKQETF
jgi:hypothetical protein